jgi:hypothetical protein
MESRGTSGAKNCADARSAQLPPQLAVSFIASLTRDDAYWLQAKRTSEIGAGMSADDRGLLNRGMYEAKKWAATALLRRALLRFGNLRHVP